jgi:[protein-PII] uridylyltransferase
VFDAFRNDVVNKSLFLEIIKQPNLVGHKLRLMHKYGILGAYIPSFSKIIGLMQFDLFHIFTVDEHILWVIKNLRLFGVDECKDK